MGQAISGQSGKGSLMVYQAPKDYILQVESVQFSHDAANAGGPHWASVYFGDANLAVVMGAVTTVSVPDGATAQWNYGVGMVEAKQDPTGGAVPVITAPLPEMSLYPGGMVIIQCRLGNGAIAFNDKFSDVVIYADLIRVEDGPSFGVPDLLPGLLYG